MMDTPTPLPISRPPLRTGVNPFLGRPLMGQTRDPVQEIVERCLTRNVNDPNLGMDFKITLAAGISETRLRDFIRRIRTGNETDCELMRRALRERLIAMSCVPNNPVKPEPEHKTEFRHGRK